VTDILDGRALATSIREQVRESARALAGQGIVPKLVIVVATDEEATLAYVRSIVRAAESIGIAATVMELPTDSSEATIAAQLHRAGEDPSVHGVLLQMPLPAGLSAPEIAMAIPVEKDIDGANPLSLGRLSSGLSSFAPATAVAVMELLAAHGIPLAGRPVAVVGRSTVVGKPLGQLLLAADATVTVCHSKTKDLAAVTSASEVVVAAAGRAHLLGRSHIGKGAVVIDVGTNVDGDGRLVGDVDGEAIDGHAGARSPVPGGVGPVTTAIVLRHAVEAAQRSRSTLGS
jgi:methylenetetrahydrofolate dehydrogenase (NADP+) / methenyltetrahydrofolate cyclohydrolase